MTRHDEFDTDDQLRAVLRDADPARSLSPADPAVLAHLLEDIMSSDLDLRPAEPDEGTRATGTQGRNRLTWLVAVAAAVVIAGAGGFAISNLGGDSPPPTASDTTDTAPDPVVDGGPVAGETTELTAPTIAGKCAAVTPELVAAQQQAFTGTVTAIEGDQVTLQATEVYAGEVGETVVVTASAPAMRELVQATKFEVGGTYLVSANDGMVGVCGFSGKATGELRSTYDKAFGR